MNLGSKDKKGGGIKKLASSMGKCCLLHDIRLSLSIYTWLFKVLHCQFKVVI